MTYPQCSRSFEDVVVHRTTVRWTDEIYRIIGNFEMLLTLGSRKLCIVQREDADERVSPLYLRRMEAHRD